MIDFSSESRKNLIEELHSICGECFGSGFITAADGSAEGCPNNAVHASIANDVEYALEGAKDYKLVVEESIELEKANTEMGQVIAEFSNKLQAIGEAARNGATSLDEISDLVYGGFQANSLNQIRAAVLREMIYELHYELGDDKCICGEAWSEEDLCAEARRILSLADTLSTKDENEDS